MKIFLGFLALLSCTVHHVASHRIEGDNWRTNPLQISQNPNFRNPLLLGSSASLTVLDKLQNIRNKLEEIENKNTDLPMVSPGRGPENQFHSINSFVDDHFSVTSDNKERANAFEMRPFSMLEKIPVMPSSLNGYFVMFRMKQNASNLVPTKSQSIFTGNEQQQFIQQLSTQKPAVSQQQPFTVQKQATNQQQSLNNQQMHVRKLNIQDQSSNHGSLLNGQHNLGNQQQMADNRVHHINEQQRSINQRQSVSDRRSSVNSHQFSSNEGRLLNGQQNEPRPVDNEKTSIHQHFSVRNLQQAQQQPASDTQQVPSQQGILRINHQSTISQYIRPQERTVERTVSNLQSTENPTTVANNFEHPSGQQIRAFTDELLTNIQNQALNGESQPAFIDNLNGNLESRTISDGATSHQASLLSDLERTPVVPDQEQANGGHILHEIRLSNGASVTHHLKTPYANYDFSHRL